MKNPVLPLFLTLMTGCATVRSPGPRQPSGENPTDSYASVIGWEGDHDAAIAYPDGFQIRDGRNLRIDFHILDGASSYRWSNAEGHLPCLVTETRKGNLTLSLQSFGDKLKFGDDEYVVVYSRLSVKNLGSRPEPFAPRASKELVRLAPDTAVVIAPQVEAVFDYAIAIDRFGKNAPWPADSTLRKAGNWDRHYQNMKSYWERRLSEIADVHTPDESLNEAYRSGFISTQIVKDGISLNVGENGYDMLWDHDAIGIFVSLLSEGDLREAKELFPALPSRIQFDDAAWKYPWPWALYLLKTDDLALARRYYDRIKAGARQIAQDRRGPGGVMGMSSDIDTNGLWTVDNWSALTGLAAYRYVAHRLGKVSEEQWARREYASLLSSVNGLLRKTIGDNALSYIPASISEANDANRTRVASDANWAAHFLFGRWAWDGWLLGAPQSGPGLELIDASYRWGLDRLKREGFPPHTFGGYPGYSSGYNAGYGSAALRGSEFRSEGIHAYQFLIKNAMSGPYSWWETILDPSVPSGPKWEGVHPSGGVGSCPHIWGQSVATKVLIDSLAAEFYDGRLLVGRGVPDEWLMPGKEIRLARFPIAHNQRLSLKIAAIRKNKISVDFEGGSPAGDVWIDLPIFLRKKIIATSVGRIAARDHRVIVPRDARHVEISLGPVAR